MDNQSYQTAEPVAWMATWITDAGTKQTCVGIDQADVRKHVGNKPVFPLYASPGPMDEVHYRRRKALENDAARAEAEARQVYIDALHQKMADKVAENDALRALLLEFRKATQFESNGQMYTLSGIPRELTRRIDAALGLEGK
jgi:hypothetical protein